MLQQAYLGVFYQVGIAEGARCQLPVFGAANLQQEHIIVVKVRAATGAGVTITGHHIVDAPAGQKTKMPGQQIADTLQVLFQALQHQHLAWCQRRNGKGSQFEFVIGRVSGSGISAGLSISDDSGFHQRYLCELI